MKLKVKILKGKEAYEHYIKWWSIWPSFYYKISRDKVDGITRGEELTN